MNHLAGTAINILEVAGALSGVPFVGATAIMLREIKQCCDQIVVHKTKSRRLTDKCTQLVLALRDQSTRLEGSELQQTMDEVQFTLERIMARTRSWSRYNRVRAFIQNKDIENGLEQCHNDLDTILSIFNINAHAHANHLQHQMFRQQRADTAEMKDLLYQILTSKQDMRQVAQMQVDEPEAHAAEMIMEAGQLELRNLRESTSQLTSPSDQLPPVPLPSEGGRYLQYQRSLMNLHRDTGIPPSVKILNGEIEKIGDFAIAGGTYSDIWLGRWLGSEKVALKALRNIKTSDPRAKQRFEHEMHVWAELKHKHILAFYGIVTDVGQHIHMVSPWQDNGNVLDFVKRHPDTNRMHLLSGAAQGIEYLHNCNVVHGNMKCANILVSADKEAKICDFGMSKVIEEVTERSASVTLTSSGSARWLAPELIEGSISSPTTAADTYSFAMAILELLTVLLKKTPPRPSDESVREWLTDDLWVLMQECWCSADSRPTMSTVASRIQNMSTM